MKIVDRKTFLAMPPGTIFNKWVLYVFGDLCIKGETWGNDFLVQHLDSLEEAENGVYMDALGWLESGESIRMDFNAQGRDGLFDDDQCFAVWDAADVDALIARLTACRAT